MVATYTKPDTLSCAIPTALAACAGALHCLSGRRVDAVLTIPTTIASAVLPSLSVVRLPACAGLGRRCTFWPRASRLRKPGWSLSAAVHTGAGRPMLPLLPGSTARFRCFRREVLLSCTQLLSMVRLTASSDKTQKSGGLMPSNPVHRLSCPNPECRLHHQPARGNIIRRSFIRLRRGRRRRYLCKACGKTFSSSVGTPYYRLKYSRRVFDQVAALTQLPQFRKK